MRASILFRIRFITGGVLLIALLLVVRLYVVQVAEGEAYTERAEQQYVRSVQGLFDRGTVYFTTKDGTRVSAATLKTGYTLAVSPDFVRDAEEAYEKLNPLVPMDKEAFLAHADKKGDPYEEVATQVSEETAEKIRSLGLKGVELYRDQWRYYPGGSLESHAVGFVAYEGDKLTGRYGLERYYNHTLGRDSGSLFVNFFAEIFDNFGEVVFDSKKNEAGHVVTTLEPTVARALEDELKRASEEWKAKQVGGIIMDPKTGAIYALASYPNFDLNNFGDVEDVKYFQNPLVESVYEMGSIIKPLTVASGIDAGAVNRNTTYYDAGFLDLNGYTIKNFDGKGRGTVPLQEILNQSLNTGVAFIVKTMGRENFRTYFKALEFDKETGIDLPSETHGLTSNLDSPREVEYATASFGQGIAMTPVETIRAMATLGNGGMLVTPHLAKSIVYENGKEQDVGLPPNKRVFKEETSEEITRMLVEVVDTALAGGKEKQERHTIAAKTGTAQIANPEGKGYYDDRYLHSFFGYFPAYEPRFVIFLYIVEPQNVNYASQTLTGPFMNLAKFLINYYDIPPDR